MLGTVAMAQSRDSARHVAHSRERARSAKTLCVAARGRMAANHESLLRARARIDATAQLAQHARRLLGTETAAPEPPSNVIALPPTCAFTTIDCESCSEPLDFMEHLARREESERREYAERHANMLLGEILWNVGEAKARPLVETALALLAESDEAALRAERDALRGWLARHRDG